MELPFDADKIARILNNIPLELRQKAIKKHNEDLAKLDEQHEQLQKAMIPTQEMLDTRMTI